MIERKHSRGVRRRWHQREESPEWRNPKVEWKTVTPDLARRLLAQTEAQGFRNRNLRVKEVAKYAHSMKIHSWRRQGDPIRLTKGGAVIDGQHRLNAIVDADVAVDMLFVYDLDEHMVMSIDTGIPRYASDVFGLIGVPNSGLAVAAVRRIWALQKQGLWCSGEKYIQRYEPRKYSVDELYTFYRSDPMIEHSIRWVIQRRRSIKGSALYMFRMSLLAPVIWMFIRESNGEKHYGFIDDVIDGSFENGEVAYQLHNACNRYAAAYRRRQVPPQGIALGMLVQAFEMAYGQKPVRRIRLWKKNGRILKYSPTTGRHSVIQPQLQDDQT